MVVTERDRQGSGVDRSPQPGPSGLSARSRSSPVPGPSRSRPAGCSSPALSGAGDDDQSSSVDSFDPEQDDSFGCVLRLIREFHNMEEPASVALNRCKTSLVKVYGLQSESFLALHLPTSPLLRCKLGSVQV